jgi:hypothetical protein
MTQEKIIWWRVALVVTLAFAVSLAAFLLLFDRLQGLQGVGTLPPSVTLGLPLILAWFTAAGIAADIVSKKHALALATICLLVAAPIAYLKPWGRGGGWQPGPGQVPENVPTGFTAFRFVSSFTYVSSPTNETITGVELELPWPYIDAYENGRPMPKPVGLDPWLERGNLPISMVQTESINEFIRGVYRLENVPPTPDGDYFLENAAWNIKLALCPPGLPYENLRFADLRLYYGDQLEWENGRVVELLGGRTAPPTITAYFPRWGNYMTSQKVEVKVSDMRPGETVSIEGVYLVENENAAKVRLDDWISSGIDRAYWKPSQENAPEISMKWSGGNNTQNALVQLERFVGGEFRLVVRYTETWPDSGPGCGLIDGEITRG